MPICTSFYLYLSVSDAPYNRIKERRLWKTCLFCRDHLKSFSKSSWEIFFFFKPTFSFNAAVSFVSITRSKIARAWSCFCNGYFLGDVWYFDSYCSCNHGNRYESGNDNGCRCFSRGCRRRPCISDFRYYNPCFRRSAVQPYRPCVYTDSLCTLCFFLLRSRLYCGRRNGRRPLGNFFRYHSADTYDGRNLQV